MPSGITITPKDPSGVSLPNAACYRVKTKTLTVGTVTAVLLQCATDNRRNVLAVQNLGAGAVYIGGADVTTANGILIPNGAITALDFLSQCELYAVSDTAGQDVRVLEAV